MTDASSPDLRAAIAALRPRLSRFAYGLTSTMDDADDLVQSTYERALSRLHQWQPGTRLDSWLFRIAQSIWFNQLGAQKVRRRHAEQEHQAAELRGFSRDTQDDQLTLSRIRQLVWQLPDEQRVVLLLVAIEGHSYREVAEILDLPVGTVTSRLSRARTALRLAVYGDETVSEIIDAG